MRKSLAVAAALLVLAGSRVRAQVPSMMAVQGVSNATGTISGTVSILFDGSSVYEMDFSTTTSSNGLFNLLLPGLSSATFAGSGDYEIQFCVSGTTLTAPISVVPFAYRAAVADNASSGGVACSSCAFLASTQTFTGQNTFTSSVTVNGIDSASGYSLYLSSGLLASAGTITAADFVGNGSQLTGILSSVFVNTPITGNGTSGAPLGLESSSVTLQGNAFNGDDQLVQLNGSGNLPALNGAALTSLDASNLTSGTIGSGQVSGSYTGITGVGALTAGAWNASIIGLPYGGTGSDLSTTGGSSMFLKQASGGAAVTVSSIAAGDIQAGSLAGGVIASSVAVGSVYPGALVSGNYLNIAGVGTLTSGSWDASVIGLAYGGTDTNLTTTGGYSMFLKQAAGGAAVTVSSIAAGDIQAGVLGGGVIASSIAVAAVYPAAVSDGSYLSIAGVGTLTAGTWAATPVGLAYGGTDANLSTTGGGSMFLKQASGGAAVTVSSIAASDIQGGALANTVIASSIAVDAIYPQALASGSYPAITGVGALTVGTWNASLVGLPYGGTNANLSATGGSSMFLKQASGGANVTVSSITASDIQSGTLGGGVIASSIAVAAVYPGALASGSYPAITGVGTLAAGAWNASLIGLPYGGTNANLSTTGGASMFLKQASGGATVTVSSIAASDIQAGSLGAEVIASSVAVNAVYPAAVSAGTYSNITLPAGNLSGTISGNTISGGTFGSVNGSALTALTAANLAANGTFPTEDGSNLVNLNPEALAMGTVVSTLSFTASESFQNAASTFTVQNNEILLGTSTTPGIYSEMVNPSGAVTVQSSATFMATGASTYSLGTSSGIYSGVNFIGTPNGSVVLTTITPSFEIFRATGSATFTTPPGATWLRVRMVGGGGGGGGSGTATSGGTGTGGGSTTFGSGVVESTATGGKGGTYNTGGLGGTATLASSVSGIGLSGASGSEGYGWIGGDQISSGGDGGQTPLGGHGIGITSGAGGAAVQNTGSGGGGGGLSLTAANDGGGGGAGGYAEFIIPTPASSYNLTVGSGGAAGAAGTSGYKGGAGGSGIVIIEVHYGN